MWITQQIAIVMGCNFIYTRCGIEPFDEVLNPLWSCIRLHHSKGLATFLKVISFVIPIMHPEYVSYTKEVTVILIREFQTSGEEMEIALEVVKQCDAMKDVTRHSSQPFKPFWAHHMALDRCNYRQVVETTVELTQKSGVSEIIGRTVNGLKDNAEPYQKMVMETIIATLGVSDTNKCLEVHFMSRMIYSF